MEQKIKQVPLQEERNCLYVERYQDSHIFFKVQISYAFNRLCYAQDINEACSLLKSQQFKVIVIDIYSVEVAEIMRYIKNDAIHCDVPVIGVTTGPLKTCTKNDFIKAGFDDFVFKPLRRPSIAPVIKELLIKKEKVSDENNPENDFSFLESLMKKEIEFSREVWVRAVISNNEKEKKLKEENEKEARLKRIEEAENRLKLSKLSCLYIEDDLSSQILFRVQLKYLKSLKMFTSYKDAIPTLEEDIFDLIILDLSLETENGENVMLKLRNNPKFSKIPIIAVSAYVLPGDREKFIEAGFDDYIAKPIFEDKIVSVINRLIK